MSKNNRNRRNKNRKWNALDPSSDMSCSGGNNDTQNAGQSNNTMQVSEEYIEIIDSCNVNVSTTDTKAALNVQAGLQAAILIIITISIGGDSERADRFTQDLMQSAKIKQLNYQHTYVENSRDVTIETTDTQLALNIQLLLQLLVAVALVFDIL